MKRIRSELGQHPVSPEGALSKHEIATALCRIGFRAGLWSIPEFDVDCGGIQRKIDVVWARRNTGTSGRLWDPVAAFEIEGHNVNSSIKKNVESLCAAAKLGATMLAMVLFQVGPDGDRWYPNGARGPKFDRAKRLMELLLEAGASLNVETVHDVDLFTKLEVWQKEARKLRRLDAR